MGEDASLAADLDLLGRHHVPASDLLGFYRKRITAFDAERQDMLQRFADVEVRGAAWRGVMQRAPCVALCCTLSTRTLALHHRHPSLQAQNAELHRVRWELRSRDEEVRELQVALSSAKLFLYDEREAVLRIAAENDELKAAEVEDRRRIAHLLALTEPMTQEVRGVL